MQSTSVPRKIQQQQPVNNPTGNTAQSKPKKNKTSHKQKIWLWHRKVQQQPQTLEKSFFSPKNFF
jgi:hypothetical protein